MKRIISIILIGMMTAGCGKTTRLERLEREAQIVAEWAHIEAARLANRSFLERSWNHVCAHKVGYGLGALLVAAGIYYIASHSPNPKQQEEEPTQGNNPPAEQLNFGVDVYQNIEELNQHAAEHFSEDNMQLPAAAQNQIIQNPLENVEIPQQPVQQGMQVIEEQHEDDFVVFKPGTDDEELQLRVEEDEEDIIDTDIGDNPAEVFANSILPQEIYLIGTQVNEHVDFNSTAEPVRAEDAGNAQAPNLPQPKTQIKGSQEVNVGQQINIPQMLADYAAMKANHTEPIIVEVDQPVQNTEVPRVVENAQPSIDIVIPKQLNQQPINNLLQTLNPLNELSFRRSCRFLADILARRISSFDISRTSGTRTGSK